GLFDCGESPSKLSSENPNFFPRYLCNSANCLPSISMLELDRLYPASIHCSSRKSGPLHTTSGTL
ncbi:uncharacterized protein METZ01_LOCUS367452, partial [marine metagenome]